MRKILLLLLIALASCTSGEKGGDVTLKFGIGSTRSAKELADKFKEVVEAENVGIKVDIYPDLQLGGDREVAEAVQFGDVDITSVTSTPLASFHNNLYILDIPFLFANREEAYRILDGEIGQKIVEDMKKKGLTVLAYTENGFRNMTLKNKAITKPSDLAGIKIRVMENDIHLRTWELFGANPTPMAFTELFTALQQGTVDGQENPMENIYDYKFYEVNPYIIESQHAYSPYVLIMNTKRLDSLSEEQKAAISKASVIARDYQRERAQFYEQDAKQRIVAEGKNTFTILTVDQKNEFRKLMSPIYDRVRERVDNPELLDSILKELN